MNINKGSIETMLVEVVDEVDLLAVLPLGTTYDIQTVDGAAIVADQPATVEDLRAMCLIDTSLAGFVAGGDYDLFLKFSDPPDSPILGPHKFRVV